MSFSIRREVSTHKIVPQVSVPQASVPQASVPQVSAPQVSKTGVSKVGVSKQDASNVTKKIQNFGLDMFSLHKRGESFIYSPPDVSTALYESEELFFDKAKNRWITIPISKKN